MIGMIDLSYRRELAERHPLRVPLNQVFIGSPGTGKTTVAKLYGQILADLGLLSKGEVVLKNPSDFIGDAVGKSERNTRAILTSTVGKVLVIDEAYMLHPGDGQTDSYRSGVIDTLVAEVQGVLGEDRCIILVGYEDKLKNMFHHTNPGLSRRFPIENPLYFENFTVPQLEEIMKLKMKEQDLSASEEALCVARELLKRALMRPNFSNAGEVESMLSRAKLHYEARYSAMNVLERPLEALDIVLEPEDFNPDFKRSLGGQSNCRSLLQGLVDESVIFKLESYEKLLLAARKYRLDPCDLVPINILFKGPPGTGKTTTALKMGKIFYDLGFLSSDLVISCTATDLIGQYVGQTAPKTKIQLEKALSKVLIIDEAHQLKEGHYATEAVNGLIQFLTRKENSGRMVVIIAGSTQEMNELMASQPALSRLFLEEIVFETIKAEDCISLLERELVKRHTHAHFLSDPISISYEEILARFYQFCALPSWSNAREIQTLAKRITAAHIHGILCDHERDESEKVPPISSETIIFCLDSVLQTQKDRSSKNQGLNTNSSDPDPNRLQASCNFRHASPPPAMHTHTLMASTESSHVFRPISPVDLITEESPLSTRRKRKFEELKDERSEEEKLSVNLSSGDSDDEKQNAPPHQVIREPHISDAT